MRIARACIYAATLAIAVFAQPAVASDICDRACLEGMIDRYVAALVAHDPARLPLARNVRFTENGQELRLGSALWKTATGEGKYRLRLADPDSGQAAMFGTVTEAGKSVLLALRLKVDYGLISEIETIVARPTAGGPFANAGESLDKRGQPRAQFLTAVPSRERMSRSDLIRIANSYFTGLAGNTGKNAAPFWPSCLRLENGTQTNSNAALGGAQSGQRGGFNILAMSCLEQQQSGFFPFVTSIRNRRFPLVDRERGLVLSFGFFEHDGALEQIRLANGIIVPSPIRTPTTFQIAELFQIHGGRIDQVEAVLNTVPYGMASDVWDQPHVQEFSPNDLP